jgi:transposase
MLSADGSQQIFLATEPVDMRGGFDRLAGRVLQAGLDLYAGHLFVFLSKRRTHLKVLTWDGTGLLVLYKRLSKGCFPKPDVPIDARTAMLDPAALAALLHGVQVRGVGRSKTSALPTPTIDVVRRA